MPHFFISYAKKDTRDLAISLSDALNALPDVTAWVDRSLKAGASWELQIQSEIDKCDYFVVLYSPDLNRHKQGEEPSYVLKEISYTLYTAKKPIIPVMAQKTQAPFSLTDVHYIDFTIAGLSLDDLLEAICGEAGIQKDAPVEDAPKPQKPAPVQKPLMPSPPAVSASPKAAPKTSLVWPFDWCYIPAGEVTIQEYNGSYVVDEDQSFYVPAFYIAKYPITQGQFAQFISAGGYENSAWWTEQGWNYRKNRGVPKSRLWQDNSPNGEDCPVIGLGLHEAIAFCLWLSDVSGEKIMVSTEQQWQRAAQGDDGRVYPWGNQWDASRCNNSVSLSQPKRRISPVRQYEGRGNSPFGVVDMAGNCLEQCLTDWETGGSYLEYMDIHILRGGACDDTFQELFRVNCRIRSDNYLYDDCGGFRIVCNLE